MRTREEIEQALNQLRDCFQAAEWIGDDVQQKALSSAIMALRWVLGSNEAGGFGQMLAMLNTVDKALDRHGNN
jgi:hypothetical protein